MERKHEAHGVLRRVAVLLFAFFVAEKLAAVVADDFIVYERARDLDSASTTWQVLHDLDSLPRLTVRHLRDLLHLNNHTTTGRTHSRPSTITVTTLAVDRSRYCQLDSLPRLTVRHLRDRLHVNNHVRHTTSDVHTASRLAALLSENQPIACAAIGTLLVRTANRNSRSGNSSLYLRCARCCSNPYRSRAAYKYSLLCGEPIAAAAAPLSN